MNLSVPKYRFITVEGNIGAGKSSLARLLHQEYGGNLILEQFAENPFLARFYDNPQRFGFHTEVYFMLDRQQQLKQILASQQLQEGNNVSDYLFNKSLLFAAVNLEEEEFSLFESIFNEVYPMVPQPELLVYIHATTPRLLQNIKKRGRDFEQSIQEAYLKMVEQNYLRYFRHNEQLRILLIHADSMDFVENADHYEQILHWLQQDYPVGVTEVRMGLEDKQ